MTETKQTIAVSPPPVEAPRPGYNLAIGYLRAFVTLLVLAHHAVLAYHPYAPPPAVSLTAQPQWWRAFPIVDTQRFTGAAILAGFNDTFFMSLMFFLSGLFVWRSLHSKGTGSFLRSRLLRLGLPFLAAAAIVAPLAYYPTYLLTTAHPSFAAFAHQWLSLDGWPSGPAWFIWLLLAFDCIAALLFKLGLNRTHFRAFPRPATVFALLLAVSALAYVPMALNFGPLAWTGVGPFVFQTSRLLHYAVYFLAGIIIGAHGVESGLLAPHGPLAKRWLLWPVSSLLAFALAVAVTIAALTHPTAPLWNTASALSFVLSCATSSFACLAIFLRFATKPVKIFDSLRDNAYGMYLVHYAFVTWLQYAVLQAPLSALTKASLVFLGTVALSWTVTAAFRARIVNLHAGWKSNPRSTSTGV